MHVHKVETVGEVYMVIAGSPVRVKNHAALCAAMALGMMASMPHVSRRLASLSPEKTIRDIANSICIHIGLNSGPIVAGVCGLKSPRFKLFGDTVNTASRMESTCPAGKIQVSSATAKHLAQAKLFQLEKRGELEGKGKMITHFLVGFRTLHQGLN